MSNVNLSTIDSNESPMSTMIQIQQISIFLIVAPLLIVISQPLNQFQHNALMQVYDDLGEFLVWSRPTTPVQT